MGLWKKRECDFENVSEGRRRLHLHEKRAKYEQKLKEAARMTKSIPEESDEEGKEEKKSATKKIRFAEPSSSGDDSSHEGSDEAKYKLGNMRKKESMAIPKLKSIQGSDIRIRKHIRRSTTINMSYEKLSDDLSDLGDFKAQFSPNYFIHECSSDSYGGSVKSCGPRL